MKFDQKILKFSFLSTKVGDMVVIGDDDFLYFLKFVDNASSKFEIEKFALKTKATIIPGVVDSIRSIENELELYFDGILKEFKTPLNFCGTPFQKLVWKDLIKIPYGHTQSYLSQSTAIGKSKSYRAVANANGANQIAIVIPCHRIIKSDGSIGGYNGGVELKKCLIDHEKLYL